MPKVIEHRPGVAGLGIEEQNLRADLVDRDLSCASFISAIGLAASFSPQLRLGIPRASSKNFHNANTCLQLI
jgi:hypothetical protein